jgi:hypothetical protein
MRSQAIAASRQKSAALGAPGVCVAALLISVGAGTAVFAAETSLGFESKPLEMAPLRLVGGLFAEKPHGIEPQAAEPFHAPSRDAYSNVQPKQADPRMPIKAPDRAVDYKLVIKNPLPGDQG